MNSDRNRELLAKRDALQEKLDAWYEQHREDGYEMPEYKAYLEEIGYLVPEGDNFSVTTENVDAEIAEVAGPQLVVPIMNARFALNAANARWGSLYDALYGTDALGDLPQGKGYDAERGARVIAWARGFLNDSAPLTADWSDVAGFSVDNGELKVRMTDGGETALADPAQYTGFKRESRHGLPALFQDKRPAQPGLRRSRQRHRQG
jgi:malate synthase